MTDTTDCHSSWGSRGTARRQHPIGLAALALTAWACSATPGRGAVAQDHHDASESALAVLERALNTLGSPVALAAFGPFEVRAGGTLDKRVEG